MLDLCERWHHRNTSFSLNLYPLVASTVVVMHRYAGERQETRYFRQQTAELQGAHCACQLFNAFLRLPKQRRLKKAGGRHKKHLYHHPYVCCVCILYQHKSQFRVRIGHFNFATNLFRTSWTFWRYFRAFSSRSMDIMQSIQTVALVTVAFRKRKLLDDVVVGISAMIRASNLLYSIFDGREYIELGPYLRHEVEVGAWVSLYALCVRSAVSPASSTATTPRTLAWLSVLGG